MLNMYTMERRNNIMHTEYVSAKFVFFFFIISIYSQHREYYKFNVQYHYLDDDICHHRLGNMSSASNIDDQLD